MDKNSALNIIAQFRDALEKKGTKVERIILFGSYAKNGEIVYAA